ncbi:MAG: hypothetical protein CMB75_02990 [Euryarchaeota archaeon]|mgnify:FL=1|nr:hypothetical protein [Euryarchaeota archaeon]|tara:strand:- start:55 stop:750 length:696 start_codon:yes stop_codon:yes gene_type:complete
MREALPDWLFTAAQRYNLTSLENRDAYAGLMAVPMDSLSEILDWTFRSLPDEILVGLDVDTEKTDYSEELSRYIGSSNEPDLFAGQGMLVGRPHLVNRGDSYEVHHVPEEWVDGLFSEDRGPRGGRFTHWLHTHPNAPAVPSGADAEAAQFTEGVDLILGVWFSPEGAAPWFDDVEGVRRPLTELPDEKDRPMIGRAVTGHRIHGLELIAFHKRGLAINVVLTDSFGMPIE